MNLDETSCRLFYERAPGILGSEPIAASARKGFIAQQVTRKQKRGALSLLALLCDDTAIQPILPQVIIGNESCLPEGVRHALMEASMLMSNVTLLRRKSAWANDQVMSEVVPMWGRALRAYSNTHQPILLLDACTAHLGPLFLRACSRWGIWVVFVPASMTWLLQPADTHCFAAFKRCLRQMFEQSLLESRDGLVDTRTVILHLDRAIRSILQGKKWYKAFDENGWGCEQKRVRPKILQTLLWMHVPEISAALPTLGQFESIFPKRRDVPLGALLNHYKSPSPGSVPLTPPRMPALAGEPIAPASPWYGRLRSSSRLHLQTSAAVSPEHPPAHTASQPPPLPPPAWPPREPLPSAEVPPQQLPRPRVPVGRPLHRVRPPAAVDPSPSSHELEAARPCKSRRTSSP